MSPYFDSAYFDPAYFDTGGAPPVTPPSNGSRRWRYMHRPDEVQADRDDEFWLMLTP